MNVNIYDIFATKYYYVTIAKDMEYFIKAVRAARQGHKMHAISETMDRILDAIIADEPVTIDVAGAVFTTDASPKLTDMQYAGLTVIDSKMRLRNEILCENANRIAKCNTPVTELPEFTYNTNLMTYLDLLDKGKVYSAINYCKTPDRVRYALYAIISICRPEIEMLLPADELHHLLMMVHSLLPNADLYNYKKFLAITDDSSDGVLVLDFTSGYASLQGFGQLTLEQAVVQINLIPYEFGTVVTASNPTFKTLMTKSLDSINAYLSTRPKTLAERCGVTL